MNKKKYTLIEIILEFYEIRKNYFFLKKIEIF